MQISASIYDHCFTLFLPIISVSFHLPLPKLPHVPFVLYRSPASTHSMTTILFDSAPCSLKSYLGLLPIMSTVQVCYSSLLKRLVEQIHHGMDRRGCLVESTWSLIHLSFITPIFHHQCRCIGKWQWTQNTLSTIHLVCNPWSKVSLDRKVPQYCP